MLAVPKTRRTQQERSAETRLLLLDAAVALIHDRGLNNISTTDVAYAAGVSRGALTHHFVSREDLVAAAIEHMLDEAIGKLKSYTAQVARARASSDELIDFLYDLMADRLFYATLEYLPEARHNKVFRNRIVPMIREWHAALDLIWSELMQRYGIGTVEGRDLMNATMCLIRGMIAQTIIRDDPPYFKRLLRFWKASVRAQLAETMKKAKPKARQRARQLRPR